MHMAMAVYLGGAWDESRATFQGVASNQDEIATKYLFWLPRERALEAVRRALEAPGRPILVGYEGPYDGARTQPHPPTGKRLIGWSRLGDPVYGDEWDPFEPLYMAIVLL